MDRDRFELFHAGIPQALRSVHQWNQLRAAFV